METKYAVPIIAALILVIAGLTIFYPTEKVTTIAITNFEECVAAGFPVMESYPRQCNVNGQTFVENLSNNDNPTEEELKDYFAERIWQVGQVNLGAMPIEGFDPQIFKQAFPLLEDYDFHNTQAYGGIWKYDNGELIFERDNTEVFTSADGTLTEEGVKTLYHNLKIRMDFVIQTKEDIDAFIESLTGNQEPREINCELSQRNAEACIEIYRPVCGYVQVECITTPCDPVPQTFSNDCFACMNKRVEYYTQGVCESN